MKTVNPRSEGERKKHLKKNNDATKPPQKDFSTALPLTIGIAALAQALNKPKSYVPSNAVDKVQELARNAEATLELGMDMSVTPTPYGTMKSAGTKPRVAREEVVKNPNAQPITTYYEDGTKEVVLEANYNHAYFVKGSLNGEDVTFLVDTGASNVSIPWRLGNVLGLDKKKGRVSTARTANGLVQVYEALIDTLKIGDIELQFVGASVNQGDASDEVLLGMSALKKLEFTYKDGKLYLRQRLPVSRRG